jgi:hypothetical protein
MKYKEISKDEIMYKYGSRYFDLRRYHLELKDVNVNCSNHQIIYKLVPC